MPIPMTGTGGLFTRLGQIGFAMYGINQFQDTPASGFINGILAQYTANPALTQNVPALQAQEVQNVAGIMGTLQSVAQQTILSMVGSAVSAQAGSLANAMNEIIQEMQSTAQTVKACNVAITASSVPNTIGNGVIVSSTKRGDGLTQANAFQETLKVICSQDAQTGGATAGSETFSIVGGQLGSSVYNFDFVQSGSGANSTLNAVNGNLSAGSNILTNSGFENFTSNVPNNWTLEVGTAGTDEKSSTNHYDSGVSSVEFSGTGILTTLSQMFNSTAGTIIALSPQRSYAVNFWLLLDVLPASGSLIIELTDGSNTVLQDAQGVANTITIPLTTGLVANTWTNQNMVFRTPRVLPSVIKIRLRLATAISSGSNLFMDRMSMTPLVSAYPGGPGFALFSGSSNFIAADGWNVSVTNDRGSSSYGATFQSLFDRLFGMRGLNFLLPSSASPTIADTLITV